MHFIIASDSNYIWKKKNYFFLFFESRERKNKSKIKMVFEKKKRTRSGTFASQDFD